MSDLPEMTSLPAPIAIDRLSDEPFDVSLNLNSEDCQALASYLEVPAVEHLNAAATVTRFGTLITVRGELSSRMTRICVASLQEMQEEISEDFLVTYTTDSVSVDAGHKEIEADLDAPEPLEGDHLPIGDVILEQLVLAMDPHPRREDSEPVQDPRAGERISPFSVLDGLKPKS